MSEITPLREAVDTLASRTPSPDFSELKARANRRGRRRVAMVATASAAMIAGSALALNGLDIDRRTAPVEQPKRSADAERIIADGRLYAYGGHESGAVLTVWWECHDAFGDDCDHAWSLGTGARQLATGVVTQGEDHAWVSVSASEDGFLIDAMGEDSISLRVALDGSVTSSECRQGLPPVQPGRLVWDGMVFDTAGVYCPTRFGGDDVGYDTGIEARFLDRSGGFTADGSLWAMVSNEDASTQQQTIGKFDGSRWHYRDLALEGASNDSEVAAAGSNVVVLGSRGISITTDGGTNWGEVTDLPFLPDDPEDWAAALGGPSVAFAGSSTLYVSDERGRLWRSTDLTTFQQIDAPKVLGLKSAGDDVLAWVDEPYDLARITADGRVEPLTVR